MKRLGAATAIRYLAVIIWLASGVVIYHGLDNRRRAHHIEMALTRRTLPMLQFRMEALAMQRWLTATAAGGDAEYLASALEKAAAHEEASRTILKELIFDHELSVELHNELVELQRRVADCYAQGRNMVEEYLSGQELLAQTLAVIFNAQSDYLTERINALVATETTGLDAELSAVNRRNDAIVLMGGMMLFAFAGLGFAGRMLSRRHTEELTREVAERRAAEAALREREENLRITLDSIGDAVIVTDNQSRIMRMNPVAETMTGWSFHEASGRSLLDVFHIVNAETRRDVEDPVRRVLQTGAIVGLANDTLLLSRDGTEYMIADSAAPVRDAEGITRGVVLIFHDVTEQYEQQRRLRESEERSELAITGTRAGLWDWKVQTGEIVFNERWAEIIGYTLAEIEPVSVKTWTDRIHSDDVTKSNAALQRHFQRETDYYECEVRMRHKSGGWIWVLDRGRVVEWDSDGRPVRMTGTHADITERKRMQEKLIEAQKMDSIGNLAGGVAHDFNNMLAGIAGYASLLAMGETDSEKSELLDGILAVVKRAGELTQKLLAFGRRGKNIVESVDLNDIVREVHALLARSIDDAEGIRIETALDGALRRVDADPAQMNQVLMNLCVNARDAMRGGGTLTVKTENLFIDMNACASLPDITPGDYVVLTVSDTGSGMNDEVRRRLFEPFFTTKKDGEVKGTGLGLATVYGVVTNHGGAVTVDSAPGHGATFRVFLPTGDKPATAEPPRRTGAPDVSGTVLIVEDDPVVRDSAARILRALGCTVLTATDGRDGVELYTRRWPEIDGVLLDMRMPGMDGKEAFVRMKQVNPEVRVLLSTGYGRNEEAQELLDLGVRGLLCKPYQIDMMAESLRLLWD